MATTVVKNAGRAKYNAAQKKHSQRTPLPPRDSTAAKEANAIVKEAAQAVVADAKAKRAIKPRPGAKKATAPAPSPAAPESANSKSFAFATFASEAGWEVEHDGDVVTASRGAETVTAAWDTGRWDYAASSYTNAGHKKAIINASAAKKIVATPVDAVPVPAARREKGEPTSAGPRRRALPFSPAETPDEDVLKALRGHKITWRNGMTEEVTEVAIIPLTSSKTRLDADDLDDWATRQLTFCDAEGGGYRSLRLSALLSVSPKPVDDGHMLTFAMARARKATEKGKS